MEVISQIEIRYFRSIHYMKITNGKSLNIISGANDAGKSNILKALNLFFNYQTDFLTDIDFYRDFNLSRLREVRQESVKGKQFIQIKVTFKRGDRSPNTLPEFFTVTRTWHRESKVPNQTDDLVNRLRGTDISLKRAQASLSRFLNSIRYIYIPAIKDSVVYDHVMSELRESLSTYGNMGGYLIRNKLIEINSDIEKLVQSLNSEYEKATGVTSSLSLPTNLNSLYASFLVNTSYDNNEIPLEQRGDGIKIRYIPSILNFISNIENKQYIWGFEEPENSLEYKLCINMASDFQDIYSSKIQVFTTTHSPAFISLKSDHTALYRTYKKGFQTKILPVKGENQEGVGVLNDELGLTKLLQEQHAFYLKKLQEFQEQKEELERLKEALNHHAKPTIITEGKTDVIILKTAWTKLYPEIEMPFNITSCDLDNGQTGGGSGGCNILKKYLESIRHDHPHVAIGLFDYDQAGMSAFQLDRNYSIVDGYSNVKKNKNGKGYAVMLPVPEGKESFETSNNLSIEFYFDEEDLKKEVDGYQLGLNHPTAHLKLGNVIVGQQKMEGLEYAQIVSNTKTVFAEKVVPTFPAESFKNFDSLFEIFNKIIGNVI